MLHQQTLILYFIQILVDKPEIHNYKEYQIQVRVSSATKDSEIKETNEKSNSMPHNIFFMCHYARRFNLWELCNTEAFGGSYDETTFQDIKIVNITCNGCFNCINGEGDPANCGTVCLPSATISPTHIIYQWNPTTGEWDTIGTPSGSCQQYTTAQCSPA